MRSIRFRLKTLMLLIFGLALAFGAVVEASKMDTVDWDEARRGALLFVPFLIMVALKFGLVVAVRARRDDPVGSAKPSVPDDPLF